jgi:hypothetical protein
MLLIPKRFEESALGILSQTKDCHIAFVKLRFKVKLTVILARFEQARCGEAQMHLVSWG